MIWYFPTFFSLFDVNFSLKKNVWWMKLISKWIFGEWLRQTFQGLPRKHFRSRKNLRDFRNVMPFHQETFQFNLFESEDFLCRRCQKVLGVWGHFEERKKKDFGDFFLMCVCRIFVKLLIRYFINLKLHFEFMFTSFVKLQTLPHSILFRKASLTFKLKSQNTLNVLKFPSRVSWTLPCQVFNFAG